MGDFYKAARQGDLPEFDVLVTNPPYSADHVDRLFSFAKSCGRPCLMLVPNYCVEQPGFDRAFGTSKIIFVGPHRRYTYKSPSSLRPGLANKQRKYVAPYVTL